MVSPLKDFGLFKNGWSGPEYNHLDREQYEKLEDSVEIKPGGTWDSRHQKRNFIFGMNAWAITKYEAERSRETTHNCGGTAEREDCMTAQQYKRFHVT